jgi:phosphohistidine phosphatase
MAAYMAKYRLVPGIIICSAARRIRETLGMVRNDLDGDIPTRVDGALYIASAADMLRQVHHLDDGFASADGHQP